MKLGIKRKVKLAPYTSFKTGGEAEYFCKAQTKEQLKECINFAREKRISFFCLGKGSNVLVNDKGFNGLVIKISNDSVVWNKDGCTVGAGKLLGKLIEEAGKRNLGGLEWAFGIPCTVGGAVRGNAGAFNSEMSDLIKKVMYFDTKEGKVKSVKPKKSNFSYRNSIFKKNPSWIVWGVELKLKKKDREKIEREMKEFLLKRKEKQPLEYPSAGSFFQNPLVKNMDKKKSREVIRQFTDLVGNKGVEKIAAGFIIEKAGLKGRSVGGAQISNKHCNFIINKGNAKTEDIIILAGIIKQKVRNMFGIQLQEEVEYLGF